MCVCECRVFWLTCLFVFKERKTLYTGSKRGLMLLIQGVKIQRFLYAYTAWLKKGLEYIFNNIMLKGDKKKTISRKSALDQRRIMILTWILAVC